MLKIKEIKEQYPEYAAVPDMELADRIYDKFYKGNLDRYEFDLRLGVKPNIYDSSSELVQGATLGFGDEIMAGLSAPIKATVDAVRGNGFDLGEAYDRELNKYRTEQRVYRDENPKKSFASSLAGGLATGGGAFKGLANLGAIRAGAVSGGLSGTTAGFGEGEGIENRLKTALVGLGFGTGLGAAIPTAGGAIKSGFQNLKNVLGWNEVPEASIRRIIKAMEDDGLTPEQAAQKLQGMANQGKPGALADLGDNLRSLGSFTAKQPGPGRRAGIQFLKERQEGQIDRILGDVKKYVSPSSDLYGQIDDLIAARRVDAEPFYVLAYKKKFVSSPRLDSLRDRPSMKDALKRAYRIAKEEGRDPSGLGLAFNEAGDVVYENAPSMQTMDYVKRGIDDILESYRDKTTGILRLDEAGRAINATRKTLVDELKRLNPDYAKALAAWSGPTKSINAMNMGRKFASRDPEQIVQDIARLPEGDKHFYKIGVAKGIQDAAERTVAGGNKVRTLMGSPKKEKALSAVFDSQDDFLKFKKALSTEGEMFESFAAGTRGSPTQPLQAESQAMAGNALDFGRSVARGDVIGATGAAVRHVSERMKGVNPLTAEEISRILYQSDPAELAAYMASINRQTSIPPSRWQGLLDLAPSPAGVQSGILAGQQ